MRPMSLARTAGPAQGNGAQYEYTDAAAPAGAQYRLEAINNDQSSDFYDPTGAPAEPKAPGTPTDTEQIFLPLVR
jgi:hypothetical protein